MARFLRSAFLILMAASALGLGGCGDGATHDAEDAEIERLIVGTWRTEVSNTLDGVMVFDSDGSMSGYWSNTVTPKGWRYQGLWWVTNGGLASVITNTSAWNYTVGGPIGTEQWMRILQIDDQVWVGAYPDQTNRWSRQR